MSNQDPGSILNDNSLRRQSQRFRLVALYCLLLAPWIGLGVVGALQPTVNSPLDWVDSSFQPRSDYDRFCERFGAGDTVVISWPGCSIEEGAVDEFVRSLEKSPGFYQDGKWLFRRVLSGRDAYLSLTSPPIEMPPQEALRRLSGTLIGPDGRTTCVVVFFNAAGLQQRTRLVPLIRAAATRFGKAEFASQHLAGPIMDGYAVDRSSQLAMQRFAPLSSIIAFCACILCLEGFYTAMLVFGLACLGQAFALAIMHHLGGSMTALLIVIPPLIQVLAISSGVHFVNYYRTASRQLGPSRGIGEALRLGTVPCVLSAATTAIGLGSLSVSGLSAVRDFGVYAALGVIANVVLLLALLPGLLALPLQWNLRRFSSRTSPEDGPQSPVTSTSPKAGTWWNWNSVVLIQQRFGTAIGLVAIIMMVGLGLGTMRLEASVRIETLFGKDNRLIEDYRWIEKHVGAMVPIETVVHFDPTCKLNAEDRITILRNLERRLNETPSVRAVTSCLGFLPMEFNSLDASMAPMILDEIKPWLQRVDYFSQDESGDHWRLTAHLSAVEAIHYGELLEELKQSLAEEVMLTQNGSDARLEVSGLMPLVHGIQSQLLRDLFASFMTAFVLIALVMTIAEAGILAGLVSMVPNVFPTFTLFGILGWIGASIDIGSIMTASVAMGIAVDDTLHFLSVFRRQLDQGESRFEAVRSAYSECGRAMIQTTLICGSGLAIFAFSDFVPTARFAWMMVGLLGAALIGDLIVLPAFLLSPIGKVFELPRQRIQAQREWIRFDGKESLRREVNARLKARSSLR